MKRRSEGPFRGPEAPFWATLSSILLINEVVDMEDFLQRQSQAMIVINLILLKIGADLVTTPQHTESDRGKEYTRNLLTGHHRRIFTVYFVRLSQTPA